MSKTPKLPWADNVDDAHYDAALGFLALQCDHQAAVMWVDLLRKVDLTDHRPGDLLRAANLEPLPLNDSGVSREIVRAINDGRIQPALVIRFDEGLTVADGFHRLSAAYHLAPFHPVPVKLAA